MSAMDVTEEQRVMLLSATRMMLGTVRGSLDDAEKDFAWEKVYGSDEQRFHDAKYRLSLAVEAEENWKRLLKVLA